jgi:hypothetical protein
MITETITQRILLVAGVPPQTVNGTNVDTDKIDMRNVHRACSSFPSALRWAAP